MELRGLKINLQTLEITVDSVILDGHPQQIEGTTLADLMSMAAGGTAHTPKPTHRFKHGMDDTPWMTKASGREVILTKWDGDFVTGYFADDMLPFSGIRADRLEDLT